MGDGERHAPTEKQKYGKRHPAMDNDGVGWGEERTRRCFQSPRPGITLSLPCGTCGPGCLPTTHWLLGPSPCPLGVWVKGLQLSPGVRKRPLLPGALPRSVLLPLPLGACSTPPEAWPPPAPQGSFTGAEGPPLAWLPYGGQLRIQRDREIIALLSLGLSPGEGWREELKGAGE